MSHADDELVCPTVVEVPLPPVNCTLTLLKSTPVPPFDGGMEYEQAIALVWALASASCSCCVTVFP